MKIVDADTQQQKEKIEFLITLAKEGYILSLLLFYFYGLFHILYYSHI